jgi:hypothetical protein
LEWRAFKPYLFGMMPPAEVKFELASAFQVNTQTPFKYGIVFMDDAFLSQHTPQVLAIQAAWHQYQQQQAAQPGIEAFWQTPELRTRLTALQHANYWTAGQYTLEMQVQTAHPTMLHKNALTFVLSPEQSQILSDNVTQVARAVCGLPAACPSVYPAYQQS